MPMVNKPESVVEWRKMLEETKREVRDIKAIESQLRWNMQREEKRERASEEKAGIGEMRDWRWRQNEEMKAYRATKEHEKKITELRESKSYQEFKRDAKAQGRQEEKKSIEEDYLKDRDYAQWRKELAKANIEREKELQYDRIEDRLELREIRNLHKVQEKMEADENRAHEQILEMQHLAREVAEEKAQLLQNLEWSRAACQKSPQRNAYPPSPALGRLS